MVNSVHAGAAFEQQNRVTSFQLRILRKSSRTTRESCAEMRKWAHTLILWVTVWLSGVIVCNSMACACAGVAVRIDALDEVAKGTVFIARVNITGVSDFDAANYDVTFDPAVLEVTDVTDGIIDGGTIPVDMWGVIAPGEIRVVQNVPGLPGVSGSGYLAEIRFRVIGSAGESSEIKCSNGVLSDNSASEIAAKWSGDSVYLGTAVDASSLSVLLRISWS